MTLDEIDAKMLAVQRDYVRRSVGLPANDLRKLERDADTKLRSLRAQRAALVRRSEKT